jgi:hypothetical protein
MMVVPSSGMFIPSRGSFIPSDGSSILSSVPDVRSSRVSILSAASSVRRRVIRGGSWGISGIDERTSSRSSMLSVIDEGICDIDDGSSVPPSMTPLPSSRTLVIDDGMKITACPPETPWRMTQIRVDVTRFPSRPRNLRWRLLDERSDGCFVVGTAPPGQSERPACRSRLILVLACLSPLTRYMSQMSQFSTCGKHHQITRNRSHSRRNLDVGQKIPATSIVLCICHRAAPGRSLTRPRPAAAARVARRSR